jgi:replicative DNA helicase
MSDKILEELRENTSNLDNAITKFVEQNNRMQDPLNTEFEFLKWIDEGRMLVLGGGSGLGKTAYVLQLIYNLTKKNKNHDDGLIGIYASSEMMVEELTMRLIVNQEAIKNVTMKNVRKLFNSSKLSKEQLQQNIKKAKSLVTDIPFYFLNASKFNLKNLIEMIKSGRKKNPTKRIFIVIDYLQLLLLDSNSLQETNRTIKDLKDALVEYKANAIIISALNRDAIKNNYVDMSAFKDSSMIEYTSDLAILFAFKNKNNNLTLKMGEEDRNKNEIELYAHCIKNRIGKMFSTKMIFNKLKQNFKIMEEDNSSSGEIKVNIYETNGELERSEYISKINPYDII